MHIHLELRFIVIYLLTKTIKVWRIWIAAIRNLVIKIYFKKEPYIITVKSIHESNFMIGVY